MQVTNARRDAQSFRAVHLHEAKVNGAILNDD
jgi:hypothetical protein